MLGKMEMRAPPGSRPRDGRHCDLCGCSQPAVRCDKCGCQIFCLSCDDMYHRHPKRRFHLRKAVDPMPSAAQARPVLPVKVAHLNATSPGDPSKMPLPPPRKKKSLFGSFRRPSPSSDNSPPLPKKEYSWTNRLGSIKKFMSNRPLPPLPNGDDQDEETHPTTNGQTNARGDLSFIHKRTEERPPQLPARSPRPQDYPEDNPQRDPRVPTAQPHMPGQVRNGFVEPNTNHMNTAEDNPWNNRLPNHNGPQAFGTLSRQNHSGFMPPGVPGYPGGMHQSSSATDLHNLHNAEAMTGAGPQPPHYPHYPVNPHMPPHYPYPMYPQYPNYPQYFGNSFANLSNPPTTDGDFSDQSESTTRHLSKKQPFRKRAKRSQSVMMDRMAFPGQFYPFGPYPGYGPWGAPMPMEAPPSPASSIRSLNRAGRARRRKKATSEEDDEEFSVSSSPLSRPKSSSSDRPSKDNQRAPLATQTTSSEEESEDEGKHRRNKVNTIQRRTSESMKSSSSPAMERKRPPKMKKKSSSKQSDSEPQDALQAEIERRSSKDSNADQPTHQQTASPSFSTSPPTWECKHCTFMNPISNKICQVCCKTATPRTETPASASSRPSSSAAENNRKQSVSSEKSCSSPDKVQENEEDSSKKDKQEMAILNSALDEAEKEISRGLEELMKLKDDMGNSTSQEKSDSVSKPEGSENKKPVYKSSGRMRTSILDKLNINKPQTSKSSSSTSTEVQTGHSIQTTDKIIEARRHSNSSTTSETYNSPLAQSPELETGFNKQKRDSSCQTQQDGIAEYLERKRSAEESYMGRPVNNFGFGYNDRMDMVTSPVPSMYDRFLGGGGLGMMQRSHSRASLFTGRLNDLGPVDYGGPGFGYGGMPMYRSASRGSLTGDYPDSRMSEFSNLRRPDYYLSMEELVERRRQDNIRAQGLELVRMIREAEQQGFTADDIQVALTHCGKQSPMDWLQDNWRNMVDSVITLSTNYGNDKKENDIGLLSESEARDALRLHKGNIWAAVTECVEGRQRKYLELSARGKFSPKDIVDALTSSDGDVEMAYAKLSKSTGKPFLMRIWGAGEGAQNQDGAQPITDDLRDMPNRYLKDDIANSDYLSDDLWSEGGAEVEWEEDEEYDEERGDLEDLQTCREDLYASPQEMITPESDKSDYCDAFALEDRNISSPSDDIFFVIPEAKPEKKKGFLSKLAALRKNSKEQIEDISTLNAEDMAVEYISQAKSDAVSLSSTSSTEQGKGNGALNALRNTFSAIKDTVTGGSKIDKKIPCAQPERRTIIVRSQLDDESLSAEVEDNIKMTPVKSINDNGMHKQIFLNENRDADKRREELTNIDKGGKLKIDDEAPFQHRSKLDENRQSTSGDIELKPNQNILESFSKEVGTKIKIENKKPSSLAERLKLAKQSYSSKIDLSSCSVQNDESLPSTSKTFPNTSSVKEKSPSKDIQTKENQHKFLISDPISKEVRPKIENKKEEKKEGISVLDSNRRTQTITQENLLPETSLSTKKNDVKLSTANSPGPSQIVPQIAANQSFSKTLEPLPGERQNNTETQPIRNTRGLTSEQYDNSQKQKASTKESTLQNKSVALNSNSSEKNENNINLENNVVLGQIYEASKLNEITASDSKNVEIEKTDSNLKSPKPLENVEKNVQLKLSPKNNSEIFNEEVLNSGLYDKNVGKDSLVNKNLENDDIFRKTETEHASAEMAGTSKEFSNMMPKSKADTTLSCSTPITEKELTSTSIENEQINTLADNLENISSKENLSDKNVASNEYKKNQIDEEKENQIAAKEENRISAKEGNRINVKEGNQIDIKQENQIDVKKEIKIDTKLENRTVQLETSPGLDGKEHSRIPTMETGTSSETINKEISNLLLPTSLQTFIQNLPEIANKDCLKAQSKSNENIAEIFKSEPGISTEIKIHDETGHTQNTEFVEESASSSNLEHTYSSSQVSDINQSSKIENIANSVTIQTLEPVSASSRDIQTRDVTNINENKNRISDANKDYLILSISEDTKKPGKLKSKTGKLKKSQLHVKDNTNSQADKNSSISEPPVLMSDPTSSNSLENNNKTGDRSNTATLESVLSSPESLNKNAINKQNLNDRTDSKDVQNENQAAGETVNSLSEADIKASPNQIETTTSNKELHPSDTTSEVKKNNLFENKQNAEISNELQTAITSNDTASTSTKGDSKTMEPSIVSERENVSSDIIETAKSSTSSQNVKETLGLQVEISQELLSQVTETKENALNNVSTSIDASTVKFVPHTSPSPEISNIATIASSGEHKQIIQSESTPVVPDNSKHHSGVLDNIISDILPSTDSNAISSSSTQNLSHDTSDKQSDIPSSTDSNVISSSSAQNLPLDASNKQSDIPPSTDSNAISSSSTQNLPHDTPVKQSDIPSSIDSNAINSSSIQDLSIDTSDKQSENDNSTSQAVDSDETDIPYSDDSRPNSVTPPSPVDALRSRFEGLSGGLSIRGSGGRPQSPFRRMSLNSTKQVIAMERIRDTSVDKPWFHKKTVEPVKSKIPKRSIKQQLEMERKVRKMVADRKVRTYRKAEIVVQLMDMNFEEEDAITAASDCSTLEQAISYLQQECQLCAGHFSVSQIVSMTHCEHRACRECIRAYFTVQIRDRTILDLLCPFCNEPDISDEDVAQDYFNHLDIMLKKLVDIEIHELFQRKLRDRVLMKDPNFRWCSQCSSGFIAMPNLKRLVCPDCNAVTCASCRRLWERDHQGISCEAFAALKDASDPEAQAAGLAKLLTEDGIDCPCCHFKYALAKGGCMHFRCIQCQHDFCSGCSRPFKMGQKCGVSDFCAKLGLHAHHPRNCLFYLRDKEPEDLQKLLDLSDVKYNRDPPDGMDLRGTCQVMEQKETTDGMVDDYCGKEVQDGFAGLCRVHYVEYLGQLVNKNKVDPIQIFDNDDLELVLRRANIRLPPKRYRETDSQYREKLVNVIQDELPLDKMDGS